MLTIQILIRYFLCKMCYLRSISLTLQCYEFCVYLQTKALVFFSNTTFIAILKQLPTICLLLNL